MTSNYFFPTQAEKIEGLGTPYQWVRELLYGNEVKRIADAERLVPSRSGITDVEIKKRLWNKEISRQRDEEHITYREARERVISEFEQYRGWKESGKPYLCFPYARNKGSCHCPTYFKTNTGKHDPFWLYMYYRVRSEHHPEFRLDERVYFRIHGVGWYDRDYQLMDNTDEKYNSYNVHFVQGYPKMETTIRFMCDRFEEIRLTDRNPVSKSNFRYAGDKRFRDGDLKGNMRAITSMMRSQGITPVGCMEEFEVVYHYPHNEQKDGSARNCRLSK